MTESVNSVVVDPPPRSDVLVPSRMHSNADSYMARDARMASGEFRNEISEAAASIIASGFAMFFPKSAGAVPCGASVMTTVGAKSSPNPRRIDSLPAMLP